MQKHTLREAINLGKDDKVEVSINGLITELISESDIENILLHFVRTNKGIVTQEFIDSYCKKKIELCETLS